MSHLPWIFVVIIGVLLGAYFGSKYPQIDLIGKVVG